MVCFCYSYNSYLTYTHAQPPFDHMLYKRSIMAGICLLFQVILLEARIENLKYYPVFSSLFQIGKT